MRVEYDRSMVRECAGRSGSRWRVDRNLHGGKDDDIGAGYADGNVHYERIGPGTGVFRAKEENAEIDLMIDAVFESMDIKKAVFRELDEIYRTTSRPGAVMGLHFFSPANPTHTRRSPLAASVV